MEKVRFEDSRIYKTVVNRMKEEYSLDWCVGNTNNDFSMEGHGTVDIFSTNNHWKVIKEGSNFALWMDDKELGEGMLECGVFHSPIHSVNEDAVISMLKSLISLYW